MGAGGHPEPTRGRRVPGRQGSAALAPRVGGHVGPAASPATSRSGSWVNSPPCAVSGQAPSGDTMRRSKTAWGNCQEGSSPPPAGAGRCGLVRTCSRDRMAPGGTSVQGQEEARSKGPSGHVGAPGARSRGEGAGSEARGANGTCWEAPSSSELSARKVITC